MPKLFTDTTNTINPQSPNSQSPCLPAALTHSTFASPSPLLNLPLSRSELFTRFVVAAANLALGPGELWPRRFLAAN